MKVFHGNILCLDARNTTARYLVEKNGKIAYVGDTLPENYQNCERIELGSKALIPAFADTHIHFASFATFHAGLNVMEATSNRQILAWLKEYAATAKEKLLITFGASPYSVEEGRLVTREELDSVCPDKPVFMVKYDGHACVVNTPLLKKIEKKVSGLRGYHADTGEMNQEAFFAVSDYVTNAIPILDLVKNMQKAADFMASKGIGMIHTVSGVGFAADMDVDMERWCGRGFENGMQLRVFMQTMQVKNALKRKLPRIGGCFACALDGCFGSQDAAMNEPYEGSDNSGVLYYSDEQVIAFCKEANRAGLQIEMHAIGDKAFDQATKALKAALDDYPRKDHRHAIIHDCLPTPEGIQICADYHIAMPVQTAFIDWRQEPDAYLEELLGKERCAKLNPIKTFLDNGIVMGAGSDGPCTSPDPIVWLHKACNHAVPEQSIGVYEALRMCTYNGYWLSFDEKERGSLEKGKFADMVLLSENPYEIPVTELKRLKVEQLYLQGEKYRPCQKGAVAHIFKGMKNKQAKI
ncbi:MAG: amidohydrolase family protein [Clostridia bacterium]|nr:amidohydrolase family protein [Clostridia bacterium]